MKPGQVTRIRVNPTDSMSVVDVVKKAGIYVPGMSFSSAVSLTLSSLLQTMRDHGVIPERTGFEYNEVMGAFSTGQNGRKLEITKAINELGSDFRPTGLSKPREVPNELAPISEDVQAAGKELTRLLQKRDTADVWTNEDEQQLQKYMAIVYPTG